MRRTKILAATFVASTAVAVPALASPASAELPEITQSSCGTLGDPLCGLLDDVKELLEPLAPVTDPILEPVVEDVVKPVVKAVDPILEPVLNPSSPNNPLPLPLPPLLPEPAPEASEPTPAPADPGDRGIGALDGLDGTKAVNSGTPAPFRTPIEPSTVDAMEQLRTQSRVPSVPTGSSLDLTPLGIPALSVTSELGVPSLDEDLSLPAPADNPFQPVIEAVTAGTSSADDESTGTAAILAIVMLAVATGLLVDQARRPFAAQR